MWRRYKGPVLLALLGVAGAIVLLSRTIVHRSSTRPSILFVTIDTLRADHCSTYGYFRLTTPRLSELAATGVRFEVAYAPMATTGPSHSTMFTSLLPRSHGVLKNGHVLSAGRPTLARALAAAGYQTGAVVSSYAVHRTFGLDQGFLTYDDDFTGARPSIDQKTWEGHRVPGPFDRRANDTGAKAVAWLDKNGYLTPRRSAELPPFFLWVHFFDPHSPYDPPAEHLASFAPSSAQPSQLDRDIAAYDGEIHFADEEMGKVFDELARAGRLGDTLIVVAGDHGEGLMQHGHKEHGLLIYEEAVRVPLIFRWPGRIRGGRTIGAPVQLVDLTPTILDLAGLPPLAGRAEGVSMAPALIGGAELDHSRPVFLQRRLYEDRTVDGVPVKGEKYAVRMDNWKYIAAKEEGTYELYDLEADPSELRNLYAERSPPAGKLAAALEDWLRSPAAETVHQDVSEEEARRLRALGYVQ